jgi:L-cysteine desulfidase
MKSIIIETLKHEIKPAVGCTEPVAVAYAAALAKELLQEEVQGLKVLVNSNLYKNGMGVFVPGTTKKGLHWAAVLGALVGDAAKELEVLENMPAGSEAAAEALLNSGQVTVDYLAKTPQVYIEVTARGNRSSSKVIIKKRHGNVVLKGINGKILYEKNEESGNERSQGFLNSDLNIKSLRESILTLTKEDLSFLAPVIEKNLTIGHKGKSEKLGLGVGYTLAALMENGRIGKDVLNEAKALTAGASDARMSGVPYGVYSCAGSGNQGLAASLPVIVMAEELGLSKERLLQGLALSFMVTIYVKERIGRLSPLCGCGIAAGVGSAAAIGDFLNMTSGDIEKGIQNIIGNLTGMICDGAKPGCALKLSTCVGAVMEMMFLAKEGTCISDNEGITGKNLQKSIENLGELSRIGMENADELILNIMTAKNQ